MNCFMFCASRIRAPCRARGGDLAVGVDALGGAVEAVVDGAGAG